MTLNEVGDSLDKRKFQERLAAKKTYFDVGFRIGVPKNEIDRLLRNAERHCCSILLNITIRAGQIASERNTEGIPMRSAAYIIGAIRIGGGCCNRHETPQM